MVNQTIRKLFYFIKSFQAKSNSGQSLANATHVDIAFGEEVFDTDNAFASDKFTVPSGKAGRYFFDASTIFKAKY